MMNTESGTDEVRQLDTRLTQVIRCRLTDICEDDAYGQVAIIEFPSVEAEEGS